MDKIDLDIFYEELLPAIDGRNETAALVAYQPDWLIESVLMWCSQEGALTPVEAEAGKISTGLPLILPGRKYHISLSSLSFQLLRDGLKLIIDDLLSNPQNWAITTCKIGYELIFGFINHLRKIGPDENIVLSAVSKLKKERYRGMKKGPGIDEITQLLQAGDPERRQALSSEKISSICNQLVDKNILRLDDNRYNIIF